MKRLLALAGALALAASAAWAQLPISGLPSASTPLGGTEVVPIVQGGVTKKVAAGVLATTLQVTPQAYGALANSNGTTGNGHDDTAAFQAALNAAIIAAPTAGATGGALYIPCGTYRVTSGLTATGLTYPNTINIIGAGQCSQIYLDTPATATFLTVSSVGGCAALYPCMTVQGVTFITPHTNTSSVFSITNWSAVVFNNVNVNGYTNFVTLTSSFGPVIMNSSFSNLRGYAVSCTADPSCNNGIFWNDKVFSSGAAAGVSAFVLGGGANNISIRGLDCEANYGCIELHGVTSLVVSDSYIERNTNVAIYAQSGTNTGVRIANNWFYNNGVGASMDLGLMSQVRLDNNTWNTQALTLTSATSVAYGTEVLQTGASLAKYCPVGTKCAYTKEGVLHQWGGVTTSAATPGTATVTLPLACPSSSYNITLGEGDNTPSTTLSAGSLTTTGFAISSSVGPATAYWAVDCQ